MNAKQTIVSAIVALFVVVLGFAFFGRPPAQIVERVVERVVKELGATSGPDSTHPNFSVNGVRFHPLNMRFANSSGTATTTPCALQAPATATTTLISGYLRNTTATGTAGVWTVATSTTFNATTSLIQADKTIGSSEYGEVLITAQHTITPSSWIVFGVKGGGFNGFKQDGRCAVLLMEQL